MPSRFDAPVTATTRVRDDSSRATSATVSSAVRGSKSANRTAAPTASAARIQGRMLASWSSRVTITSSSGPQVAARVRARSKVSAVMLRPNTIPRGSTPSRSPMAARAASTTASAARSAAVTEPRFASGDSRVPATAAATVSGTCDPPGPSKCAAPAAKAGKWARIARTS